MALFLRGHVRSHNKLKTLDLLFYQTYDPYEKIKVSQAHSYRFLFQEALAYKRQIYASPGWIELIDGVRVLSSVIIIAQSDIKNIQSLISCLQKISLEQLLSG